MIKSAMQYPVHTLLSHEGNLTYRVPAYQREYSWQKGQWENLFDDLIEAEGAHFLGTIITLDQTTDAVENVVLEVVDGQQRLTTLTVLLAAAYSILKEHFGELDEDQRTDLVNLSRQLVRKADHQLRVIPQTQGSNLDDYKAVLEDAGLALDSNKKPYFPMRRIARCFRYFRESILKLAETTETSQVEAAVRVRDAVQQAVIVKIEVASHADAFVLFESLNNRGMPLTPVDLIKTHLLAESERKKVMGVDEAFKRWNGMLTNLGDNYATQERFLRHYYNAFKSELPEVANASVATRANLIRIYETVLSTDVRTLVDALVSASALYGRITCATESAQPNALDRAFRRLLRAQGAPSYVLLMWLMTKRDQLALTDQHLIEIADQLTSFFVRRNLTGYPPTYVLPKLFMTIIDAADGKAGADVVGLVRQNLRNVSGSDDDFRARLEGAIYDENTDVTRFILTTLAEDAMTTETWTDLWATDKGLYKWTIEHILPQGPNLPEAWKVMLGGAESAADAQSTHVHKLGNLTITMFNSTLGNKSFAEKRDRTDSQGRFIGYKNGLSLNAELAALTDWTVDRIDTRTAQLAAKVVGRFVL